MPHNPAPSAARTELAKQVRDRVAATNRVVARSRQRAAQAMAHVRHFDRLLHATSQRSGATTPVEGSRAEHVVQVMEHEVAAHERAVALHEVAAELQEAGGWPQRAADARAHAAHARELARRAREELATYQARAAAAKERVAEVQERLP